MSAVSFQCVIGHCAREPLEPRLERAVDHEIARAHDRAADQRRIDFAMQPYFALQALLAAPRKALALRLIERTAEMTCTSAMFSSSARSSS